MAKKGIENNGNGVCNGNDNQQTITNEPKSVHFVRNTPVFNHPKPIEVVVPKQTFYRLVCCQLYWSLINAALSVHCSARKQLKRILS
ncbi:hypothetical protein BLOT_012324 [Blomia tropicalis]|nr:hypothetical protein BLOT_012324 [Blomia tropicalis]